MTGANLYKKYDDKVFVSAVDVTVSLGMLITVSNNV
jgi:hypothetical protein